MVNAIISDTFQGLRASNPIAIPGAAASVRVELTGYSDVLDLKDNAFAFDLATYFSPNNSAFSNAGSSGFHGEGDSSAVPKPPATTLSVPNQVVSIPQGAKYLQATVAVNRTTYCGLNVTFVGADGTDL